MKTDRCAVLAVKIMLLGGVLAGCQKGDRQHPITQIGGVVEVTYESGSTTWQSTTREACHAELAEQPPTLAAGHVWYREPKNGAEAFLRCLRKQPHVLAVALPR